jgi:hypothetical protein
MFLYLCATLIQNAIIVMPIGRFTDTLERAAENLKLSRKALVCHYFAGGAVAPSRSVEQFTPASLQPHVFAGNA